MVTLSDAAGFEWESEMFFEVVVPANRLFLRLGVDDPLHFQALIEIIVSSWPRHQPPFG